MEEEKKRRHFVGSVGKQTKKRQKQSQEQGIVESHGTIERKCGRVEAEAAAAAVAASSQAQH